MLEQPNEGDALRQGDVCVISHVPIWNLEKSSSLSGAAEGFVQMPTWEQVARHENQCLVVVCTQCCDLENPRARTGVLVAPLMAVPTRHRNFEGISQAAIPDGEGVWSYVNLFPLHVPGRDELLAVDMSAAMTMATMKAATQHLLGNRLWSMSDAGRAQFRTKLGVLFGRDPAGKVE